MNGNGIPVVGSVTVTAAMLIRAWKATQVVTPQAISDPNASGALSAMR